MSCSSKSESARERDPRKHASTASREQSDGFGIPEDDFQVLGSEAWARRPLKEKSFLHCVRCRGTPKAPPLYGCRNGHLVCNSCRSTGGEDGGIQCPDCGEKDLECRLAVAESLLPTELQGGPRPCPYKGSGCTTLLSVSSRSHHAMTCLFRPVRCPKAIFSSSCLYKGPYCTIQSHGRSQHGCQKGVIDLGPGLITSKMFDKSLIESACDEPENAKFNPLEMLHGDSVFYCYYERVAARKLWYFFVRHFGVKESGHEWVATISVGNGGLAREDRDKARHFYTGPAAPYCLGRRDIYSKGLMLAIPDEVMKANKVGAILFRVWWKVELKEKSTPRKHTTRRKRALKEKESDGLKVRKLGELTAPEPELKDCQLSSGSMSSTL